MTNGPDHFPPSTPVPPPPPPPPSAPTPSAPSPEEAELTRTIPPVEEMPAAQPEATPAHPLAVPVPPPPPAPPAPAHAADEQPEDDFSEGNCSEVGQPDEQHAEEATPQPDPEATLAATIPAADSPAPAAPSPLSPREPEAWITADVDAGAPTRTALPRMLEEIPSAGSAGAAPDAVPAPGYPPAPGYAPQPGYGAPPQGYAPPGG
ncbi:hypothetical protein [Actinotignum sp. GS-2025a]